MAVALDNTTAVVLVDRMNAVLAVKTPVAQNAGTILHMSPLVEVNCTLRQWHRTQELSYALSSPPRKHN
ncbi:hypothetical protein A2U01_0025323 [Trifolium medium]|uniref:Uncharacterized protein n=1 Tax=Trifolium medium TaxID=97028 RepID=A0A392NWT3_9FABA|nr:hypothetical protein [Trifolium medium]